jgi:hypothetical protein
MEEIHTVALSEAPRCLVEDSNLGPFDLEAGALPIDLPRQFTEIIPSENWRGENFLNNLAERVLLLTKRHKISVNHVYVNQGSR